jgi:hypothetical protein
MSTRSRKRLLQELSEDAGDGQSSTIQTADASPLSTAKKRKLNRHESRSSPSRSTAADSRKGALGKLGSILGYRKENRVVAERVGDEEGDMEVEENMEEGDCGDILDIEVPDAEDPGEGGESASGQKELAENGDDIWDIAPSDAENGNANSRARSVATSTPNLDTQADRIKRNKDGSIPKKRGRPRKNPEADLVPKKSAAESRASIGSSDYRRERGLLKKAMALSRAAIRDQMIELGQAKDAEEYAKEYTKWLEETEVKDVDLDESVPTPTPGKRVRPKKPGSSGYTPKSILTPSQDRMLKSKKSVAFNGHNELDLGFRDLPGSTKLSRAIEIQQDDESDSSDEVACAICSGVESEAPNEIIICDNCDLSVHQECYHVPIIPEGDWLCRDCSSEALPQVELDEAEHAEVPSDLPEIEEFERHLRSIQRVVLDKLTGQERINLRGHDEEMQKVYQVVEQTVLAGEGNSMLVIGARGTGKTTVSDQFQFRVETNCFHSLLNQSYLRFPMSIERSFMLSD